jgi:hypothetical protein
MSTGNFTAENNAASTTEYVNQGFGRSKIQLKRCSKSYNNFGNGDDIIFDFHFLLIMQARHSASSLKSNTKPASSSHSHIFAEDKPSRKDDT